MASKNPPSTLDEYLRIHSENILSPWRVPEGKVRYNFEGKSVSYGLGQHPFKLLPQELDAIASSLGIEVRFLGDEIIERADYASSNPENILADLRKREIIIDYLSQLIVDLPLLDSPLEYWQIAEEKDIKKYGQLIQDYIKRNLMSGLCTLAEAVSSNNGLRYISPEFWQTLKTTTGKDKVKKMREDFEKSKLEEITSYECKTGKTTFETYKLNDGELIREEYERVKSYKPTSDDLYHAQHIFCLAKIHTYGDFKPSIDENDEKTMAKLIGALENRIPLHKGKLAIAWVIPETCILQAKTGILKRWYASFLERRSK